MSFVVRTKEFGSTDWTDHAYVSTAEMADVIAAALLQRSINRKGIKRYADAKVVQRDDPPSTERSER